MNRQSGIEVSGNADSMEVRVIIWAVLATVLWGTSYVAAKYVVQWLPPFTAAAFRFLVVAILLWGILLVSKQGQKVDRGEWKWLALAGLFQTTLYFALQYAGIGLTTASNTSVIVNARPIFVVILAYFFLREAMTGRKITGILLAFAGVIILTTEGSLVRLSFSSEHAFGDFLIVLNALSGAIGLVATKRVLAKFRPLPALVYAQTFGALGLIPLAILEIVQKGGIPSAPAIPWLVLVYQAIFCSIAPHLLWNNVLARTEASRAAVFIYLTPVMTVVFSYFLLGEKITVHFAVGSLLVLAGAYVAALPRRTSEGR
jgi:drug/metabolite transporter (DMT)-like permease